VDGPGIRGVLSIDGTSPSQLLVLDDRAIDALAGVLPLASAGTVRVCEAARRCAELLGDDTRWTPKAVTAMVCTDLRTVSEPLLPDGLSLRPVRRVPKDPLGGVSLTDAVTAAVKAAPQGDISLDALVAYLGSLPAGSRILAAVDDNGVVRGTSGSRTFVADAYVFFVNTDRGWRRRGVGLSMTAAALRSAANAGARRASLDASGPGVPLYRRLGFAAVAEMTQFSSAA
jgi:ribosomal protein S18 acetylase RimI-like enzyme